MIESLGFIFYVNISLIFIYLFEIKKNEKIDTKLHKQTNIIETKFVTDLTNFFPQ